MPKHLVLIKVLNMCFFLISLYTGVHGKYTVKAISPLTLIMTSVTAKIHLRPYNFNNTGQEDHIIFLPVRQCSSTWAFECVTLRLI